MGSISPESYSYFNSPLLLTLYLKASNFSHGSSIYVLAGYKAVMCDK